MTDWPAGAYHLLAERAVPLVAVGAFFAQWVAVYLAAAAARKRTPGAIGLAPLSWLVASTLLVHAGAAALLYDQAIVLGVG